MDLAAEIDANPDAVNQSQEQCRRQWLSVAESQRTAAQIARFAGDEVTVHTLVRAAVLQEEAAERCCPRT